MSWIDVPVVDLITYFTETFVYFMDFAVQIGLLIGIFGIVWCCIQLVFGTMEVQKAIVGTITKFVLFMLIINFYPAICSVVRDVAVEMGSNASETPRAKIKEEFARFLEQLENVVAQENADIAADLAAAIAAKESFNNPESTASTSTIRGKNSGFTVTPTGRDLVREESRLNNAINVIEYRRENPSDNMKTVLAIRSVLKPVDKDGNEADTSNAEKYILDLTLKDKDGNDTGYLSPNAMLRIALLSAQIMWEKEWVSVTEDWQENDDAGFWSGMTKTLSIAEFPIGRIFDIILTFIAMIAIVLCMIFSLIQYVMAIVEFTIIISVAVICIPCMLMDGLKDIAQKALSAILAQAIKLTMITLCMFYGVWAFLGLAMNTIGEGTGFNLTTFAYVMFTIILAFVLTQNAPKLALALLNAQPQLSMGELIAAMGTTAAIGGAGIAAMKVGAAAVEKAGPAAARATMNRVGDASAIASAGLAGRSKTAEMGGSAEEQRRAVMRAMAGEGGYRMRQGLSSAFHGAAHHGMGGAGMGGGMGGAGTSGFAGANRFGYNDGKTSTDENRHGNSMKYGNAQDDNGRSLIGGEFIKSQQDAAAARATANIKPPKARTYAKYPNMVAQSSYIGTDFQAPKMLPNPPETKMLPPPETIYL